MENPKQREQATTQKPKNANTPLYSHHRQPPPSQSGVNFRMETAYDYRA